jgi:hypothetical protein
LQNEADAGKVELVIRRRRTSRHRRNRRIRRVLFAVFCAGLAIGFAGVALQQLSPSFSSTLLSTLSRHVFHTSQSVDSDAQAFEASRDILLRVEQESQRQMEMEAQSEARSVYPYSVVAGGVRDARELKWAAQHDRVVAAHYAGFDFDHARIVRLPLARTAYVSYRIGNKVFWTRHRVALRQGEMLITDGKITARSRCGNQVTDVPQQATSTSEPPAAKFDEIGHPGTGTAFANPPAPYQTSLLNRPSLPGLGPAPPLSMYDPFTGGSWVPLAPPPLPGLCGVGKKPTSGTGGISKKGKGDPCGNGGTGGEVPEPGTWLLVATGLAAIGWKTRRRFART